MDGYFAGTVRTAYRLAGGCALPGRRGRKTASTAAHGITRVRKRAEVLVMVVEARSILEAHRSGRRAEGPRDEVDIRGTSCSLHAAARRSQQVQGRNRASSLSRY